MPNTSKEEAEFKIGSFEHAMDSLRFQYIVCSVSFGLAVKSAESEQISVTFVRAATMMYQKKWKAKKSRLTMAMVTKCGSHGLPFQWISLEVSLYEV